MTVTYPPTMTSSVDRRHSFHGIASAICKVRVRRNGRLQPAQLFVHALAVNCEGFVQRCSNSLSTSQQCKNKTDIRSKTNFVGSQRNSGKVERKHHSAGNLSATATTWLARALSAGEPVVSGIHPRGRTPRTAGAVPGYTTLLS